MYEAIRIHPSSRSLLYKIPSVPSHLYSRNHSNSLFFSFRLPFFSFSTSWVCSRRIGGIQSEVSVLSALSQDESLQELDESPVSIELQPLCSETQFDRVITDAQQLENPVIIVWMASWCRKCIYLKPKLEKLAAEYHPRLRFYCVDVNKVPHKVVARAGVTRMPTIQLWKDGQKQAEVIGGHKAYFVINEVREMIENECTSRAHPVAAMEGWPETS